MEQTVVCFSSSKNDIFPSNTLSSFENEILDNELEGENLKIGLSTIGVGNIFEDIVIEDQEPLFISNTISSNFFTTYPNFLSNSSIEFDFSEIFTHTDFEPSFEVYLYEKFIENKKIVISHQKEILFHKKINTVEEYFQNLAIKLEEENIKLDFSINSSKTSFCIEFEFLKNNENNDSFLYVFDNVFTQILKMCNVFSTLTNSIEIFQNNYDKFFYGESNYQKTFPHNITVKSLNKFKEKLKSGGFILIKPGEIKKYKCEINNESIHNTILNSGGTLRIFPLVKLNQYIFPCNKFTGIHFTNPPNFSKSIINFSKTKEIFTFGNEVKKTKPKINSNQIMKKLVQVLKMDNCSVSELEINNTKIVKCKLKSKNRPVVLGVNEKILSLYSTLFPFQSNDIYKYKKSNFRFILLTETNFDYVFEIKLNEKKIQSIPKVIHVKCEEITQEKYPYTKILKTFSPLQNEEFTHLSFNSIDYFDCVTDKIKNLTFSLIDENGLPLKLSFNPPTFLELKIQKKSMDHFFVTIDSSSEFHKLNRAGNFKFTFPNQLNLTREYKVSLKSIHFPHDFNLYGENDECKIKYTFLYNSNTTPISGEIVIKNFSNNTIHQIVESINTEFQKFGVRGVSCLFSSLSKRFEISLERDSEYTDKSGSTHKIRFINFEFTSDICHILGFRGKETKYESERSEAYTLTNAKNLVAKYEPCLEYFVPKYLIIYTDFIQPVISSSNVGRVKILRTFNSFYKMNKENQIQDTVYSDIEFVNRDTRILEECSLNTISFKITDHTGKEISLQNKLNKTFLTLEFFK